MTDCTVTFAAGPQTSWEVPAGLSELRAEVAAGAGAANAYHGGALPGGTGGIVSVDLGTAYNGETLHLLVGDQGSLVEGDDPALGQLYASGGGGSYLALAGHLLVVAGGGGGSGHFNGGPDYYFPLAGGAGGFSSSSPDGSAGDDADLMPVPAAGSGAIGATPGTPVSSAVGLGGVGGAATVDADGVISPGAGGAAGVYDDFPTAAGGGGYAGGGGGSARNHGPPPMRAAGSGGGGSGYLVPGLSAVSTAPNAGAGYITLTYSFDPGLALSASSVEPGSSVAVEVSGLPAATDFTVTLDSADDIATGTTGSSGTAALEIDTPAAESTYTVELRVDGTVVASEELTVVAAPVPPAPEPEPEPRPDPEPEPDPTPTSPAGTRPIAVTAADLPDTGADALTAPGILALAALVTGSALALRPAAVRVRFVIHGRTTHTTRRGKLIRPGGGAYSGVLCQRRPRSTDRDGDTAESPSGEPGNQPLWGESVGLCPTVGQP